MAAAERWKKTHRDRVAKRRARILAEREEATESDEQRQDERAAPRELLLLEEVTARTRISDTTVWRLEKAGRFPRRLKIGFKRVAWLARDVDAWIAIGADAWAANHSAAA